MAAWAQNYKGAVCHLIARCGVLEDFSLTRQQFRPYMKIIISAPACK